MFLSEHRGGLVFAGLGHAVILILLSVSLVRTPQSMPMPQLAIEATVVDESAIRRAQAAEDEKRRDLELAEQRKLEETQRQERREQDRKAALERERKVTEQKKREAAERKKREAAAADKQRKQQEQERQAKLEQERKAQAEKDRQANLERERKAAEATAKAQREAELRAAMVAEENLLAVRSSAAMAEYVAMIQQDVERNWVRPATAKAGLECDVYVTQLPNGEVNGVRIGSCNGDAAVIRSLEAAVSKASPLPLPSDRAVFDRNLRFTFRPME